MEHFIDEALGDYAEGRNLLAETYTSHLSAYLHWGCISPFQVWAALANEQPQTQRHELREHQRANHLPDIDFMWLIACDQR